MSKSVSEILFAAADLIEPEGAWTQGASARNRFGTLVAADGFSAVCWCAGGAIWNVAPYKRAQALAYDYLRAAVGLSSTVSGWNDAPKRTQAEVVAKLREAAEKAREQGL